MAPPPSAPPPPSASSSSSWRTPSLAVQQKYNLQPLPDDFEPTPEEKELLQMYDTIQQYERQVARIQQDQAKAKLLAAAADNAKYKEGERTEEKEEETVEKKKKSRTNKKKKAKRRKAETEEDTFMDQHDDDEDDDELESDDEDEQQEQDAETLHQRREAKLAEMREKLEEQKHSTSEQDAAAEALRQQHLAEAEETGKKISLKRKSRQEAAEASQQVSSSSSLIANLSHQATPPHDFSKTLELKSYAGKILFPTSSDNNIVSWSPPDSAMSPNEGALTLELPDFDITQAQHNKGNNTLAIKFMAPVESKRFSLNIAGPDHDDFYNVLFHFNPRQHERGGQVVVNDKQDGLWGQGINIPLSQLPLIFGQLSACTLIVQINGDGFDVFLEGQHCARLEHRRQLPTKKGSLVLQFPSTDDYGSPEVWSVYKVWWGHKASMAKDDLSHVAGVNVYSSLHPRKLFVSGLERISTDAQVDLRRAELERAFRKYGGDQGAIATVPKNTTFAFVELETDRQADLALQEMQNVYRLNRARRTRHEALQEERAAAEAAKQGAVKESTEWD